MTMDCALAVILPVKNPANAKSRLSSILSSADRATLAMNLFRHTFARVRYIMPVRNVTVVSDCPGVLALATAHGAMAIREEYQIDLNTSLRNAVGSISSRYRSILILPTDLVQVDTISLRFLLRLGQPASICAIVPDLQHSGTNALLLPRRLARDVISFGPDSLVRHFRRARSVGLLPRLVALPRLQRDLDTTGGWMRLARSHPTALLGA